MKLQAIGLVLSAVGALIACPGAVVDQSYKGPPVATLQGRLSLAPGVPLPKNVRLAVVWYKSFLEPTQPDSIVTQEVAYRGTFPAQFTFDFYGAPPAEALKPTHDGKGHQAFGVLVAYEDSNGDGRLDPADPSDGGGVSSDHLLGATSSYFDYSTTSYWIQYSDVEPDTREFEWPAGAMKGFNLVSNSIDADGRGHAAVLPFDSSLPLVLTGENELVALICQGDWINGPTGPNPLEVCNRAATPHVLRVNGRFRRSYTDDEMTGALVKTDRTTLILSDGSAYLDTATVTVNGQLARSRGEGFYESSSPLRLGSANVAVVDALGFATVTISLVMPAQEPLLAPAAGLKFKSGSTLKIEWPQAVPLGYRSVAVVAPDGEILANPDPDVVNSGVHAAETGPIVFIGKASVSMRTHGPFTSDRFGSAFSTQVSQKRSIEFTP